MISKNPISAREFGFAAMYTAVMLPLLWAIGYPVDEWAAAAVVLYISLRLSCEVIIRLAAYLARLLVGYGRRVARKHGILVAENPVAKPRGRHSLLAMGVMLATLAFTTGVALTAGFTIMAAYNLPPFPAYCGLMAWTLLALGGAGLLVAFGFPAIVFAMADIRRKDWGTGIARLQAVTEGLAQAPAWRIASRQQS